MLFKVLFMYTPKEPLQDIQHIRHMMERSSRFVSLSGFSGIAAGVWSLAGAWYALQMIETYYVAFDATGYSNDAFQKLKYQLFFVAGVVLLLTLVTAYFFTFRRSQQQKVNIWNSVSRKLALNLLIPLIAGGFFILSMLQYNEWRFVSSLTLIFYGLALVNASKYTLTDIRYLGLIEIILGLINTRFIGYGLYFWAAGFGIMHILYGIIMWYKYERNQ